jgi:hypothetical protein
MWPMKRFGVPGLLLTILGGVALLQSTACGGATANAPAAASPANAASQASASASSVPAEPPASHGGGW